METTCSVCQENHFIPVGNICLRCVQKLKHRKDVEEFIETSQKNAIQTGLLILEDKIPKEPEIPLISLEDF